MNKMIAPSTMRRLALNQSSAVTGASRSQYHHFIYPHSHMGVNNAFNNAPHEDKE
jgi:predicted DNA-binding transcriptional regulator AlpA